MARINGRILLVGSDAADWKVIRPQLDHGRMPHLANLIAGGVSGNLATLHPSLSPMLWTSIATGKRPPKHGVLGFAEPLPDGSGVRPVSSLSRRAKAAWNILNQNDRRSAVVGWWPSQPVEPIDGVMVSNAFTKPGSDTLAPPLTVGMVHPPEWSDRLAELRVTAREVPSQVLRLFVPELEKVDQENDKSLHVLAKMIAEAMTTHAAATEIIEHADWDFAAVYYDTIDHISHAFMKFHPPRLDWVPDEIFTLYQHVVGAAYRYQDAMLGRLIELAGPETTVIVLSDHGFHSDDSRPAYIPPEAAGPAVEHRHFGMICMRGPGIKQGETLYGASILDIAPTVLHLFGLPVGRDMDGHVLAAALESPGVVETIASWEDVSGRSGQHPADARFDPVAASEAIKQLIDLGYVAPPPQDVKAAIAECVTELNYNLARAHDDGGRPDLSEPIYRQMIASDPDERRAVEQLFRAFLKRGNRTDARDLLDRFDARCRIRAAEAQFELERRRGERRDDAIDTQDKTADKREIYELKKLDEQASGYALMRALLRFQLDLVEERWADAERSFHDLQRISDDHHAELPALLVAELFAHSGNTEEALVWAEQALERDPENWHALSLAARLHFKSRRYEEALELAAESLGLIYFQPRTHYLMGLAQQGLGDFVGAELALRVAITQMPGLAVAHEALAELYDKELQRPADAALQRARASNIRRERKRPPEEVKESAVVRPESRERVTFNARPGPTPEDPLRDIVIVTGLPRSGTSMLMQVLVAGGINPLVDAHRPADVDNPRGYFEYEPATRSRQDDSWIPMARGNVVKLVLPLIPSLPPGESYRLIVIQRDLSEVLLSQRRMLDRLGREGAVGLSQDALARQYRQQELRVGAWLDARPGIGVLPLCYDEILSDPLGTAEAIAAFLHRTFNTPAAAAAIEPSLRRRFLITT